jgi:hypothetical protein
MAVWRDGVIALEEKAVDMTLRLEHPSYAAPPITLIAVERRA